MSDRISRLLATYAHAVTRDRLPGDTVHEVLRRILDSIGVAVAGFGEAAPAAARAYALGQPERDGATVWGTHARSTPEAAGFANAVAVRALDFNDTYLSREPLHPSDTIPPLLALAERRDLPPRAFLTAVATAYELAVTLCDAASLREHRWDHVNYVSIGVAGAAGAMLGLPVEAIEHAISIAVVPHAAMRQTRAGELSMWKGAAAAEAGRTALFAALLAEAGMTGPNRPFEGEMGFVRQLLGGEGFDERVLDPVRTHEPPRAILETYVKRWPVEYHAQSAVDAALQLRAELADPGAIDRIRIDTFRAAYDIIAKDPEKWDPTTRETADHSIQYVVCAALQDGEVTRRTFDLDRIRRRDTLELLHDRTTVEEDPELTQGYPAGIPNRITVTTVDGASHTREVRFPLGHARNPMSDDEVVAKFRANVAERWTRERAERVADLVWGLPEQPHLAPLCDALGEEGGA
ncbi:MAG: MmgE/PrpD family protein [Candidatus Velamenicoccus archaeovorus]